MKIPGTNRSVWAVVAILSFATTSNAQFFVDNFNDGDAMDGMPVTWLPGAFPEGTRDASSGDYVLSNPSGGMTSFVDGRAFGDVSIRTQVRVSDANFSFVGVFARSPTAASYFANIRPDGRLDIGITNAAGNASFLESQTSSLNVVDSDIRLQFDLFGTTLSLTAWADGTAMPTTPQIMLENDLLADGTVGVFFTPDGNGTATFRFFAAVPEPSTFVLAVVGLVWLIGHLRRSRTKTAST